MLDPGALIAGANLAQYTPSRSESMGTPAAIPNQHEVTPTEDTLQRNRAAEALIRAWLADESGYDEATFPELKRALEQSRQAVGARSPFDAE